MPSDLTVQFHRYVSNSGFNAHSLRTVSMDIQDLLGQIEQTACDGWVRGIHENPGDDEVPESTRLYRLQHLVNGLSHRAAALKSVVDGLVSLETLTRGRPCRADV